MPTQYSTLSLEFERYGNRCVVAAFDTGPIPSTTGASLSRHVERPPSHWQTRPPGHRDETWLTCPPVTVRSGRDGLDPDEVGGTCNHGRSVGSARCASPGQWIDSTA